MRIVKQYASLTEGKCSLVVITDNDVQTLSGKYNSKVVQLLDKYKDYESTYVIDTLHELLETKEWNSIKESKETSNKIEQLKVEYKEIPDNLAESLYNLFQDKENWRVEDGKLYYLNTRINVPNILMEAMYTSEEYLPFVRFWKRLCANNITKVKQRLFEWIVTHGIKITEHGLLIGYRGAVRISEVFDLPISEVYWKCKNAKKGLSTHGMVSKDGTHTYKKLGSSLSEGYTWISDKPLSELIEDFSKSKYTHVHNRKDSKKIEFDLNEIYKDDLVPDTNSAVECSRGIHFGSLSYGISSYGDALLGVLVCPSKIVAVPDSDATKARSSEVFPFVEFTSIDSMREFHEQSKVINTEIDYLSELDKEMEQKINLLNNVKIDLNYSGNMDKLKTEINLLEKKLKKLTQTELEEEIEVIKSIIYNKNKGV